MRCRRPVVGVTVARVHFDPFPAIEPTGSSGRRRTAAGRRSSGGSKPSSRRTHSRFPDGFSMSHGLSQSLLQQQAAHAEGSSWGGVRSARPSVQDVEKDTGYTDAQPAVKPAGTDEVIKCPPHEEAAQQRRDNQDRTTDPQTLSDSFRGVEREDSQKHKQYGDEHRRHHRCPAWPPAPQHSAGHPEKNRRSHTSPDKDHPAQPRDSKLLKAPGDQLGLFLIARHRGRLPERDGANACFADQ